MGFIYSFSFFLFFCFFILMFWDIRIITSLQILWLRLLILFLSGIFLPFYAILRSIPNKLLGVIALLLSIFCLFVFALFSVAFLSQFGLPSFGKVWFYWVFIYNSILLGWIGAKPIALSFFTAGPAFYCFLFFGPSLNLYLRFRWQSLWFF